MDNFPAATGISDDLAELRFLAGPSDGVCEGVWFEQALTGAAYAEIGIASTPDRSFTCAPPRPSSRSGRRIALRCDASRAALADLQLDDRVDGRGDRPVWSLLLQVLRELAQHAGHADILREQVLAERDRGPESGDRGQH